MPVQRKPEGCKGCPLYGDGLGFIRPEGKNTGNVYLIGEAGGKHERLDGYPFRPYAQSGSTLERAFKRTSTNRDTFRLYNIVNCQPPNNAQPDPVSIAHCRQHLHRVIAPGETNVIVALGNIALKNLTEEFTGDHAKVGVSNLRGYVLPSSYGYVIPTFHPSFIRRGKPGFITYLAWDLRRALHIAQHGFQKPEYRFIEHPSRDQLKQFYYTVKSRPDAVLMYDIETEDSLAIEEDERTKLTSNVITRVQFAIDKDEAITLQWNEQYMAAIQLLFLLPNMKMGHNSYNFDNPRIRDKGIHIAGKLHDSMLMFKHWHPELERGLQKVASMVEYPEPWKHLFTNDITLYGCHDVNALTYIWEKLPGYMQRDGVWGNYANPPSCGNLPSVSDTRTVASGNRETPSTGNNSDNNRPPATNSPAGIPSGYCGHVVDFIPILDRASAIGIPINRERLQVLEQQLLAERDSVFAELQRLVPFELRNLSPRRKNKLTKEITYGYVAPPKKIIKRLFAEYNTLQDTWNLTHPNERYTLTFQEYCRENGYDFRLQFDELQQRYATRWYKVLPFKASNEQLARYIEWKRKQLEQQGDRYSIAMSKRYVVPRTIKTNKPTTGKKLLAELLERTGDEIIRLVIGDEALADVDDATLAQKAGIRSISKMLSNDIRNWQPAADSRVHTTWGMTAASGQLDSRSPNILNASKYTVVGQLFRRVIEAPEGYVFVEADKKSYHVATMGYAANDAEYIRFSQLDPHSYFTAYTAKGALGLPSMTMTDSEILAICSRYKKDPHWGPVRQHSSKVIVLGNQLGLGANKAYIHNKKYFTGVADVAMRQKMMAYLFRKVDKFKTAIQREADRHGRLVNDFGYQQWFSDVSTWTYDPEMNQWKQSHGSEAEKAIAFLVQSNAFGDLRDKLLQCEQLGYNAKYNWISSVHDSVVYIMPQEMVPEWVAEVYPLLISPSRVLIRECCPKGLVVKVDVSIGRNWQKYHPQTNPEGMQEVDIEKWRKPNEQYVSRVSERRISA